MNQAERNQEELLREEMKRTGGNISKVARVLGLDYGALARRYSTTTIPTFITPTGPEPDDIQTLGRDGWQRFVIAIKRAGSSWPLKYDNVIADAREKFDNGTHEMFQTNNNGWVVQYLIPRKRAIQRKPFFRNIDEV